MFEKHNLFWEALFNEEESYGNMFRIRLVLLKLYKETKKQLCTERPHVRPLASFSRKLAFRAPLTLTREPSFNRPPSAACKYHKPPHQVVAGLHATNRWLTPSQRVSGEDASQSRSHQMSGAEGGGTWGGQ